MVPKCYSAQFLSRYKKDVRPGDANICPMEYYRDYWLRQKSAWIKIPNEKARHVDFCRERWMSALRNKDAE